MAEGDVRALLVQLRLDQSQYKTAVQEAKGELRLLKAAFQNVDGDENIGNAADALHENLKAQLEALNNQIDAYETRLGKLREALEKADPESAEGKGLKKDVTTIRTELEKAKTAAEDIKKEMANFKVDQFVEAMGQLTQVSQDLELAYNTLIGGWAKETSDTADEISVMRESALASVYKIAEGRPGVDDQWMDELDAYYQKAIQVIPATYKELAEISAAGMQAGGVAADNIMAFTDMFAKLEKATDIVGTTGAEEFGKFLVLFEVGSEAYERMGSAIVELGNNAGGTEAQILETSKRMAGTLKAAGIDAVDALALASSAITLGMEPDAAASSLEKLTTKLSTAASIASGNYDDLLAKAKEFAGVNGIYEMQHLLDVEKADFDAGWLKTMGMTYEDMQKWMRSAILAEKYAAALGVTVEEFGALWKQDSGLAFADFFRVIGQLEETESSGLSYMLKLMGITEIRESRLASAFATTSDELYRQIDLSRNAYQENTALQKESDRMFSTTESRRKINQNKNENYLASIGESVKTMRQPFDDFFASIKQGFVDDMPSWVQTGVGAVVEGLGQLGNLITGVDDLAGGVYLAGKAAQGLKKMQWGKIGSYLAPLGKAGGIAGVTAAGVAGFAALVDYVNELATDTSEISANLANLQINVDEESKNATLAAIAEVKAASEALNDPELSAQYANTSRVVKMGYGTESMFSQALGYERAVAEKEIEAIYSSYGEKIREEEKKLIDVTTTHADRMAIDQNIKMLEAQMQADVETRKKAYGDSLNDLVNGVISQHKDTAAALENLGSKYDLLKLLYQAEGMWDPNDHKAREAYRTFLQESGANAMLASLGLTEHSMGLDRQLDVAIKKIYGMIQEDWESIAADNGGLMGLLSGAMQSGAFSEADIEGADGLFLRFLQAMDIKQIGEKGAGDWTEIGRYSMGGLANGLSTWRGEALSEVEATANGLLDVARRVLQIHSPSQAMAAIGGYAVEGLAGGILAGKGMAVGAMREVMEAVAAEASQQMARINAILSVNGGGNLGVGGPAPGTVNGQNTTYNQYFSIGGGSLQGQQNIKRLAQQIARVQKQTNASIGKG